MTKNVFESMKTRATSEVAPLTSLRFFLATWIVIFHLSIAMRGGLPVAVGNSSILINIISCAYVAVGIFFVLSGFILALNYHPSEPWDASMRRKFTVTRISRIYPVYILALCAISPTILGGAIATHSWSLLFRRLGSGVLNLLMVQAWLPQAALTWNGPGWSLSNEMFFYLTFPIIGRFFYTIPSVRKAVLALLGLWVVMLIPAGIAVLEKVPGFGDLMGVQEPNSLVALFVCFNPLVNLPLFLSGIVACRLFLILKSSRKLSDKGYLFYVPGIGAVLGLCSLGNVVPYPFMHGCLMLPAVVALITGLALHDRYLCVVLSNRLLVFLGKASYAEYLFHFPIRTAFDRWGIPWSGPNQIVYVITVLASSAFVYRFYEEPMQTKLRDLLLGKQQLRAAISVSSQ